MSGMQNERVTEIAPGVFVLKVEMAYLPDLIYPILLWDEGKREAVLLDTGMPGNGLEIRRAIEAANVPLDDVKTVLLTHQDIDHIGGLPEFLASVKHSVTVLAHEADKPYIEGERPLMKLNQETMQGLLDLMVEEEAKRFQMLFADPPFTRVNNILSDGQTLDLLGGVTVIHTPGHTPGHISLYLHASRILITADAMAADNGRLTGPNPYLTPDMATAIQSLSKFANLEIDTAVCYHGGIVRESVHEQIAALISR
ncbi:MBL fold metallo-hydrolase [Alicyclobacillus acidoterrestris]|uniref:MBL fold metallo-hydrolase n=1 Tax=Alicyclobacillus acidoterrestris (strain ATCC 49025 / DSM 3922 / CIP 106132 / NCIMB 13137 / GD3B) TaxID=1356854 RepID=T0C9E9_ALIAG|nr:MBL fold metallo-hydrolase [Alicyclobacillus acidoterrestris]EPZ52808.1 hypothetical protein N007_02455 [Alicyclobacillus acidoterrestris ATCC 49025]UNO48150.1 MBL fold metallo-hydrolase [Alicyclobacillus acidoterrestris]